MTGRIRLRGSIELEVGDGPMSRAEALRLVRADDQTSDFPLVAVRIAPGAWYVRPSLNRRPARAPRTPDAGRN
mgnify:CR=1 FL=1